MSFGKQLGIAFFILLHWKSFLAKSPTLFRNEIASTLPLFTIVRWWRRLRAPRAFYEQSSVTTLISFKDCFLPHSPKNHNLIFNFSFQPDASAPSIRTTTTKFVLSKGKSLPPNRERRKIMTMKTVFIAQETKPSWGIEEREEWI